MKFPPTLSTSRIISLDVLRGFAVLGILIINIQSFSMPSATYLNPTAWGDFTGANKVIWSIGYLLADLKFMAIFSILFGCGIILFTERMAEKGARPLQVHYRRTCWLLLFGLVHAYLLWYGDILVIYALCGFLVVLFRKKKPVTLLISGIVFLLINSSLYFLFGLSIPHMPQEALEDLLISWQSTPELLMNEIEINRGSFFDQIPFRINEAFEMQTTGFFFYFFWRVSGLMLIGMALYKWGILTASKSNAFYIRLALICLIPGYLIVGFGLKQNFNHNFEMEYSFFLGSLYNYWGSVLVSLGYISVIMLSVLVAKNSLIVNRLKAVGQMAFTNYLMQTIICTFIFYGHGLGLFAKIERPMQIAIVFTILLVQMIYSPIWLKHFKYGPFEWAWRSLTYWKLQRLKK